MVQLVRGNDSLSMPTLMWEASQVFAKQEGWRPTGAAGGGERGALNTYAAGRRVGGREAADLATALKRVVNGRQGDSGELDLPQLVNLVNFLSRGAFEIR